MYDGTDLIGEYSTGGAVLRRYVHSSRDDDPQVWLEGSSNTNISYVYTNYQGSVIATTNAAGSNLQIYKYSPYGEPRDASNNAAWSGFRFRYTGQQMLPEARLYHYKARAYDPNLGTFLQTDPIGSKDDLDLYAYVGDDPVNKSDPSGLASKGGSCTPPMTTVQCDALKMQELRLKQRAFQDANKARAPILAGQIISIYGNGVLMYKKAPEAAVGAVAGAVVGGAASKVSGGKFIDGALKGGFTGASAAAAGGYKLGVVGNAADVGVASGTSTIATGGSKRDALVSAVVGAAFSGYKSPGASAIGANAGKAAGSAFESFETETIGAFVGSLFNDNKEK